MKQIQKPAIRLTALHQIFLVLCLCVLAYLPILKNGFVIDDHQFITGWEEIKHPNLKHIFSGNLPQGQEGVYRPLRSVAYAILYQGFGDAPLPYHAASIAIHATTAVLVFLLFTQMRILKPYPWAPLLGALIFTLHPVNTEAIAYIAASMDMIGVSFLVGACLCFCSALKKHGVLARKYIYLSYALGAAAMFTYEMTLTAPLLLLLLLWEEEKLSKKALYRILPFGAIAAFYLFIRMGILHIGARAPFLADSPYLTFLAMLKVFVAYISLLCAPFHLVNQHILAGNIEAFVYRGYNHLPVLSQSLFGSTTLIALIILIGGSFFAWKLRQRSPVFLFTVLWFFMSLLPVSQIIPQGAILNERSLYIPSIGCALLLSFLVSSLFQKRRTMAAVLTILLLSFYLLRIWIRLPTWKNDLSFWSSEVRQEPRSAYGYYSLGNALRSEKRYTEARVAYQKAVELNPSFAVAQGSIAQTYQIQGNTTEAISAYESAIEIDPLFFEALYNLGNLYASQGEIEKARNAFQQSFAANPAFTPAHEASERLSQVTQVPMEEKSFGAISLSLPISWTSHQNGKILLLVDPEKTFTVEIEQQKVSKPLSNYVSQEKRTYGMVDKQGNASFPGIDNAYVRMWKQDNTLFTYEFFLIQGKTYLHVVVSPVTSPHMNIFNAIIQSIRETTP